MTPDEIKAKCRKVWIVTTNGRIFGDEPADQHTEPRFVPAFRTKEIAEGNAADRDAAQTKIYNCDRFGHPKGPLQNHRAVACYLVPASKIDE